MRAPRLQLALLGMLGCQTGCQGGKKITFEILPDDDFSSPSSAELYGDFLDAVKPSNRNSLEEFGQLSNLSTTVHDMAVIPDTDHAAVDIVADAKIRATAQTDVEISAGGGLVGKFVEPVDLIAGGMSLQTPGDATATTGGAHLSANGDATAAVTGDATVAARSLRARLAGSLDAAALDNVTLSSGGDVAVQGTRSGTATFGGGMHLAASSLQMEGGQALSAVASKVDVRGGDGVHVASSGAGLRLGGTSGMEYIGFVWRSSSIFDEFENVVPKVTGVHELLINQVAGKANPVVRTNMATRLRMDIGVTVGSSEPQWEEGVWSSLAGVGEYSLNGLRVQFATSLDVVAVRLTSAPFNNPTYQGWGEVAFHFGRIASAGSVELRSAGSMEAAAEDSMAFSSKKVSIDADAVRVI